ncbi:MAG: hypothetical protein GC206_13490 [Alphaproteobacteria bacterium]|nr:hypothetical protein [Alphaproteobacteria bacterium]
MAESLPAIPKIVGVNFELQRLVARNPVRDGGHQVVELAEPLWSCEIETTPLSRRQAGQYASLKVKLRGGARTLFLYDASRPRPIAYHDVADSTNAIIGVTTRKIGASTLKIGRTPKPWGDPRVVWWSREASTIMLTGLRPNATLFEGDYGAVDDGATRRLFQATADVTADANGAATLAVEPAPPASTANLPLTFTMERAAAEMIVTSAAMPFSVEGRWRASLTGVQILRRF